MINRIFYLIVIGILVLVPPAQAQSFQELLARPISVEKLIGNGDTNVFAGWVGTLYLYPKRNLVVLSAISSVGTRVRTDVLVFDISRFADFADAIEIELVDSTGYDWRGRIWRASEADPLQVDIFRKDSPQRWAKLGKDGLKFLKDNQISHIMLEQ